MGEKAKAGRRKLTAPVAKDYEFGFVPDELRSQCHRLIVSFHEMHGYLALPDMLWKAGLASLIGKHAGLNEALQKASTARSARRANEFFVIIASEILALEVLARNYANWSEVLPAAKTEALDLLGGSTPSSRTWLIEHYLYPPRYDSPAAQIPLPRSRPGLLGAVVSPVPEARGFKSGVSLVGADTTDVSREVPLSALE